MKMNIGKRILMFLHWLLSLLICASLVVHIFHPDFTTGLYESLVQITDNTSAFFICIAILAIYAIICIAQIVIIFQHGKSNRAERGFITVDSSDASRVRIAIPAIEQMVRKSVHSIDGITDMKVSIENSDDAIAINIVAAILNGCHVPTITMNMQQAIRKFVELNCGVAVRSVTVNINAVTSPEEVNRKKRRVRNSSDNFAPAMNIAPILEDKQESESPCEAEMPEEPMVEAVAEEIVCEDRNHAPENPDESKSDVETETEFMNNEMPN